jgi:aminoglycoside 3-N-acetyltransferase I
LHIERLTSGQLEQAKALFALLSEAFGEGGSPASEAYIDRLLKNDGFWVVAAIDDDNIVGGLTAHILPMTKAEQSELLIYDVAVRERLQRRGIGKMLVSWVLNQASAVGIAAVFVLADNDDVGAISFYRKLSGADTPVTLFEWS